MGKGALMAMKILKLVKISILRSALRGFGFLDGKKFTLKFLKEIFNDLN